MEPPIAEPVAGVEPGELDAAPGSGVATPPLAPMPPPPPPPAAADPPRPNRRPPPAHWDRHELPLGGDLVYDARMNSFAAHCRSPGHGLCRVNRTCNGSDTKQAQGRPVGFLAAWLLVGDMYPDRASHLAASRDEIRLCPDTRLRGREWVGTSHAETPFLRRNGPAARASGSSPSAFLRLPW